ncbi:MAG: potassium channel family protein [Chthoniobacteraceae bacterium]
MTILPASSALIAASLIAPGFLSIPRGQYLIALICVLLATATVLVHYEVLRLLSAWLGRMRQLHRLRVLVLILGLLGTHVFEIWIYAAGYAVFDGVADFGSIVHVPPTPDASHWLDYVYFSFMTYTTVGYGDLVPHGPIRFIAATEALTAWVLLGWSASFTFLEMQRFWKEPKA